MIRMPADRCFYTIYAFYTAKMHFENLCVLCVFASLR